MHITEVLGKYTYKLSDGNAWSARCLHRYYKPLPAVQFVSVLAKDQDHLYWIGSRAMSSGVEEVSANLIRWDLAIYVDKQAVEKQVLWQTENDEQLGKVSEIGAGT